MADNLSGQLVYAFAVSILDAALLSWLALLWYRRSVRKLMQAATSDVAGPTPAPRDPSVAPPQPDAAAGIGELSLREERFETAGAKAHPGRIGMKRVIAAYGLGAATFATAITTLKFVAEPEPLPAVAWLVQWWINTWPIVPTLVALLVLDRRMTIRLTLLYVLGGTITIALFTAVVQLSRGTLDSAPVTNVYWGIVALAYTAWLPFAVIVFTGWRRVRAVLPLALAATLLFGFSLLLFHELFARAMNVETFRSAFFSGTVVSSQEARRYGLFMIVSLPVGWMAWRLLTKIASTYGAKRFSDIQLVVDCWWAVVAAEATVTTLSTTYGLAGIAYGGACFLAYRLTVAAVLRGRAVPAPPRRLLLLRVFGYQSRTESLFDRVAQTWRLHGPVQLIAGVDLAMRTADPGDLLALLNGRLAESYVRTPDEVPQRLERLDLQPDPDGRFRINEVYCHHHTWQPTLEALLEQTDRVLMDLRSFCATNAGCRFELEQLLRRLPTDDIILVCDKTTDLPLLQQILGEAWTGAHRDGRARGTANVSVVRVERQSRPELGLLMRCLLEQTQPLGSQP